MKKVKITVVIEYDETNVEAVQFVNTFEGLPLSENDREMGEDGFRIESAKIEEL